MKNLDLSLAANELTYAEGAIDALEAVLEALPVTPDLGITLGIVAHLRGEFGLRASNARRKVAAKAKAAAKAEDDAKHWRDHAGPGLRMAFSKPGT